LRPPRIELPLDVDDPEFLGELLFGLVAEARERGFDAETALREANERFARRVGQVEQRARADGRELESYDDPELRAMWEATGGDVALAHALRKLKPSPLVNQVAAVSAGFVDGELMLDLAYAEDSIADADVNVVATDTGQLVEVQGTAEKKPFSRADFDRVLAL